jgi:hypothetical protein
VLIVALLAIPVLALLRVTRVAAGHRGWALRAAAALGVVWVASASSARRSPPRAPRRWPSTRCRRCGRGLADRAASRPRDRPRPLPRHSRRPAAHGLRGKDVLLVFVESYGRVAVQGSSFSPAIDAVLDRGTAQLRAAGFSVAQRLPHLADVRRPELAGAFHPAVGGPVDGQRRYDSSSEGPPHAHPGVQARRVAGGRRHAGEPPGVARGLELLPLRPDLRPPQPRLPRPGLRLAADARPVRVACPAASRARQRVTGRRCSPRST